MLSKETCMAFFRGRALMFPRCVWPCDLVSCRFSEWTRELPGTGGAPQPDLWAHLPQPIRDRLQLRQSRRPINSQHRDHKSKTQPITSQHRLLQSHSQPITSQPRYLQLHNWLIPSRHGSLQSQSTNHLSAWTHSNHTVDQFVIISELDYHLVQSNITVDFDYSTVHQSEKDHHTIQLKPSEVMDYGSAETHTIQTCILVIWLSAPRPTCPMCLLVHIFLWSGGLWLLLILNVVYL